MKSDTTSDLIFNALACLVVYYLGNENFCGIPIMQWNIIYFALISLRSLSTLVKFYVNRDFYEYQGYYQLVNIFFVDGSFLGWLIYGNILFYSSRNDCALIENTNLLYNLMLVLIIIGYFQMLVYALILCCLPCILYYLITNR